MNTDYAGADGRLPVPSLDDRRFQDLVDQALRLRDRLCPEWTSTEPGDPGIALIEIFAYLVDQLLYRLNQVPDRLYSSFLNMVGVHCRAGAVARTRVDFFLAAPPAQVVRIPLGTRIATVTTDDAEPVEFTTTEPAAVRPGSLRSVAGGVPQGDGSHVVSGTTDWVELTLSDGAPNALVHVELETAAGGEPRWQCWTPDGWVDARTDGSMVDTGPNWTEHRLRFQPGPGETVVRHAEWFGVSVAVQHAGTVSGEELGTGTGRPRQRLRTRQAPLLPDQHRVLVGIQEWTAVGSLVDSFPDDLHFELDHNTGEVLFGDGVHGAMPPEGEQISIDYLAGGGTAGNVAAGAIRVLRDSIPFVSSVNNGLPATGGANPEPVEEARAKAPALLRSGWRAVSAADFERLTRQASPFVARARCVSDVDHRAARILLVPRVEGADDEDFAALSLGNPVFEEVLGYLDERRSVGVGLILEPPRYQGVRVEASVSRSGHGSPDRVRDQAEEALRTYLHPVRGGRDGQGWPFGRMVVAGELFGVLLDVPGVDLVHHVELVPWDPVTGETGDRTDRVELPPHGLCWPGPARVLVR